MLLMNETFRDVDMSTVTAIVIVVSPLNALINNQISRLGLSGIRASVLGVKMSQDEEFDTFDCDFRLCDEEKLRAGHYDIIFAHPESFISCMNGGHFESGLVTKQNKKVSPKYYSANCTQKSKNYSHRCFATECLNKQPDFPPWLKWHTRVSSWRENVTG